MRILAERKRTNTGWVLCAALCAGVLVLASPSAHSTEDALETLRRSSRTFTYEDPTDEELVAARQIFSALLRQVRDLNETIAACERLHLELRRVRRGKEEFLVLSEGPGRRIGRGFYVFRRTSARAVLLQAPHAFYDRNTGEIAAAFFREGNALSAGWNVAQRKTPVEGDGTRNDADLAHRRRSYYQEYTRAFATHYPRGVVVQFHGYDKSKRATPEASISDVILSAGRGEPSRFHLSVSACWDESAGSVVSLYPRDVRELGGTKNAQAELLSRFRGATFLHVELSRAARRALHRSHEVRTRLWTCIVDSSP